MDETSLRPVEIELAPSTSTPARSAIYGDSSNSNHGSNDTGASGPINESALPPTDTGLGAWSFLAAAFVVEAVVWGFPNAYGVFLNSYLQDPRYALQQHAASLLPLIGTLSTGIIYCSGVVVNPITARYPQHRRKSMWLGATMACTALLGASYATQIFQLVLLQGVVYAIGGSLLYLPCISYMSEWFVARRGMANGILFAGSSTGGILIPLGLPPLISNYGAPKTLRILSIAIAVVLFPVLPFVKGRLPETRGRVHGPAPRGAPGSSDWLRHKSFWVILAVNTLQGFAYFVPIVYLPTFASELHISSLTSAVTLSLLNAASVFGRLLMGYLSDKFNPWSLALSVLFTSSMTTFVFWGVLSHTFAGLLAFSIVYGSVASGWTSLWTGFVRPFARDDPALSTALFGYMLFSRGLGNIVSTPISASLYARPHNAMSGVADRTGFDVGDGRFGKMIIYVGTCFAGAAGVSALGWALEGRKGRVSQ
ncbi:MFS general substrate transporter [Mycena belliarum]|uniref:MFS general substrate transporter n=1 Tax=Mycena belliarum TaxID=1033014 RepID=A0AAD6U528_9AGAR|nr:MFS general substrate transporter [Mycena belliae]